MSRFFLGMLSFTQATHSTCTHRPAESPAHFEGENGPIKEARRNLLNSVLVNDKDRPARCSTREPQSALQLRTAGAPAPVDSPGRQLVTSDSRYQSRLYSMLAPDDETAERLAARLVVIGFDGASPTAAARLLVKRGVRGIILFARNAGPRAAVSSTVAACKAMAPAGEPLLVCVDQEGGNTARLSRADGFDPPPSMREVTTQAAARACGAAVDAAAATAAAAVGTRLAADLRPVGIDLNLAPIVDVDSNPANPVIGPRSFSPEPAVVSACGAALVAAMQDRGVAACAKHFPGHGDTDADSHHDLPVLRHGLARLREVELPPFAAAARAGVAAVMTTHVVFEQLEPGVPATMSTAAVTGLLRGELGFEGVVISDCLEMAAIASFFEIGEAAVQAVSAGVDLLLCCHEPDRQNRVVDALTAAIAEGRIGMERVKAAHARLDRLFADFVRPHPAHPDAPSD